MPDSPSKYAIQAGDATGVIIGEHNTIYQYFQHHPRLASKHISFGALIADKTDGFVGRQFVFDALDGFLGKNKSGYFVIRGEPGIGKTALLAQLVKTRGYPHHFNVAAMNIRTPRQFLANACAQIIARYHLPHEFLPDDATDDSSFLVQCLEEAAAKPENRPVVLVVDALDESERLGLSSRVNVLYLPPSLPEGAYLVLTVRLHVEDKLNLQVAHEQPLFLESDSDGNLLDIRFYIENYLRSTEALRNRLATWKMTAQTFTEALVKKSEGNFMYLHYVLPAIAGGKFKKGTVEELPQGLRAYYRSHWNQMQIAEPAEFEAVYAPIVCMLAVVREPVTVDQLQRWTNQDMAAIRQAIALWREFLKEETTDDDHKYRVYHSSFQDFLGEMVDLRQYDRMIALYALSKLRK